jgi:hypothetical protein
VRCTAETWVSLKGENIMPEVIGVYEGGTTIINNNGHPTNVGVIHFLVTRGEAQPETITGYCRTWDRDGIIKYLNRIVWAKPEANEEMVKAENKPKIENPEIQEEAI